MIWVYDYKAFSSLFIQQVLCDLYEVQTNMLKKLLSESPHLSNCESPDLSNRESPHLSNRQSPHLSKIGRAHV